ncbi:MAG: RNA polymerase sigma factor [Chitinophagales bacterium]|nr:RNA polymerase sigma factor [Chitinophagales bacterium]
MSKGNKITATMNIYEDPLIFKGISNNDETCQKKFFEAYFGIVMGVARRYFKNEDERWNVVNDTFLKVFKNIQSYQLGTNIIAWLRKYATLTALEEIKRKKISFEELTEFMASDNFHEMILPDTPLNVEDLLDLLVELPPSSRTVFNLFAIEGYKHNEIAEMLQISIGTSKWHLNHARKILQEKINTITK